MHDCTCVEYLYMYRNSYMYSYVLEVLDKVFARHEVVFWKFIVTLPVQVVLLYRHIGQMHCSVTT